MEEQSRTRRKQEMRRLQQMGEKLVQLPGEKISRVEMPEVLREAIHLAKTLKTHEARRRQMQYIGTLMRKVDVDPIRAFLQDLERGSRKAVHAFHRLEKLRDDLIADPAGAVDRVLAVFPDADRQHVCQLVRNAVREREKERPPKSSRALFKYLQGLQSE